VRGSLASFTRPIVSRTRFAEMQRRAEGFGFKLIRISGSHHIHAHRDLAKQINLQAVDGKAKPYQVRQFLKLIERYNLPLEPDR
jgi:predicted RNA binding protein YcfA (HicA-like mRNA interferase family)